jgi:hypothetical protein
MTNETCGRKQRQQFTLQIKFETFNTQMPCSTSESRSDEVVIEGTRDMQVAETLSTPLPTRQMLMIMIVTFTEVDNAN